MVALVEQYRILTERGESRRFISPPFSSPAPDVRQDYSAIETCPDNIYDSTEIGIVQSVDRFPMQTGDGSSESGETYSDSASYLATVTSNPLPVTFGCDPNGPLQQETVTAVQVHTVYSLRDVTIENANPDNTSQPSAIGTGSTTETIDTTDSHPFYVQGQGWVSADDLVAGEILSTPDGQTETVVGTTSVSEPNGVLVYNFTVADDHTYFVEGFGSAGTSAPLDAVWVHNTCAGLNHFWPRALGNDLPYGNRALTYLNEVDHTAVHAALNEYLRGVTKVIEDGTVADMMPRAGNAGADIIENFSRAERYFALRSFYQSYQGGQYLKSFLQEAVSAFFSGNLRGAIP